MRARLIIGLLALAAVGLVALAGVTYAEQRNLLLKRVDQQVQLAAKIPDGRPGFGGGRGVGGIGAPPADNGYGDGGGPRGPAAGTWILHRDAQGRTTAAPDCRACFSTTATAPTLPASLPTGHLATVKATNSGARYRVLAQTAADGDVIIAAVPLTETDQTLQHLLRIEAVVIAAVLLALAALSWLLVRIGLRPLDRMGVTAGQIAGGDLSHRVEEANPRTEVGRLGLSLNRMLDRLERAFEERQASEDRLRRFLADASHELRTPLASIRGYAELFRIGAARDPENTEKAMSRIEAEATRMGVLVEDLLTLARLDEVRDAQREDVDLARLAGDAVDDARATAPDRDIELDAPAGSLLRGDPHQLRQVLANLLRNALVHTPPGTPVDVSVHDAGDAVTFEVRDHGPGLPADERELFGRFWRAEAGRERGKAGAGLGLAIVAGIVHAHGGEVRAENAPGGGARFTVRLPRDGVDPALAAPHPAAAQAASDGA
ncbi:HAMP domain-containing histidine kinase [Baekduia soli]|uniref:histidine kinase n=1 Tax=Baekduia soli TaxID=496014 RepID=A0A5B8UD26_9ACTN|nr:HAMP domain-containing histidine kinase [Baekduia soli]